MKKNSCKEMLEQYNKLSQPINTKRVIFNGVDGYDVYNPTAPFEYKGKNIIIGRVEKRDSESSEAVFFSEQEDGSFSVVTEIPRYKLQDPFISLINGIYVFGGTEVFPHPKNAKKLWWKTKFYYGKDLNALKELTSGPMGMKDIRLVELKNHEIGVFTRPQGKKGGRGKIGFTVIKNLLELNEDVISNANLLDLFKKRYWGGANEAILLSNGDIGVLGHLASFSRGKIRHYYPITFTINPITYKHSEVKIIAERSKYLPGPSKRDDLTDVLFSGGLVSHYNGRSTLYVGVSDVEVQSGEIIDPFWINKR